MLVSVANVIEELFVSFLVTLSVCDQKISVFSNSWIYVCISENTTETNRVIIFENMISSSLGGRNIKDST